jgi:peptidase E
VPSDLTLFGNPDMPRHPASDNQLADFVAQQDVIYVGGGNTASLLALWRAHGLDRALRSAWEQGTVLCGVSAGMICWFQAGVTDSFGPLAPLHDGLGLLPGSACPHYDGEAERRPRYRALIEQGFPAGYAADDGAALHFIDGALHEVVSSRKEAAGYRVERSGGQVVETRLPTRYLG